LPKEPKETFSVPGPSFGPLSIVLWDDPILSTPCPPVYPEEFGEGLKDLGERMLKSLGSNGIGLSGPQVGISKKIFVMDLKKIESKGKGVIIAVNPMVSPFGKYEMQNEQCLSLPGINVPVNRQNQCTLTYHDPLTGEMKILELSGLVARCAQHENDHLLGKLIIDRTTRQCKRAALRRLKSQNARRLPCKAQ